MILQIISWINWYGPGNIIHRMLNASLIQRQEDLDTYLAIAELEKFKNYFKICKLGGTWKEQASLVLDCTYWSPQALSI